MITTLLFNHAAIFKRYSNGLICPLANESATIPFTSFAKNRAGAQNVNTPSAP
jgi:hypothetical protein